MIHCKLREWHREISSTKRTICGCAVWLLLATITPVRAQLVLGQLDNFQDGTTANWSQGSFSPNPPVNVATGGPAGASDAYLQVTSNGISGAGSKMVFFNTAQWTGNYLTAGVTQITADMANFGTTPLHMRIAFRGGPGLTQFGSTIETTLMPDSQWHPVTFDLSAGGLTNIGGIDPLNTTLGNVIELRILSAQSGPAFNGDTVMGILGVDNIRAVGVPEPGSIGLCSLALAWGCHRLRRRRQVV